MRTDVLTQTLRTTALWITFTFGLHAAAASLLQASFDSRSESYVFGHSSIPEIPIHGAPRDTDWQRTAVLHDGSMFRLYAMARGRDDTLYQFAFDPDAGAYVFGHSSIPELEIAGLPRDADTSSFSMLHDGDVYRLYYQRRGDPTTLYQLGFDPRTEAYEYGYNSNPTVRISGMPRDTDWNAWAMLHDGSEYRFYALRRGGASLYQAGWDGRAYTYGYNSISEIELRGGPRQIDDIAMLHDGRAFRLYTVRR
jgi:hypothetical protein